MKGLILTYLITVAGSIAALRYPLIGLQVYVGLAILRPQFIFGFAGDLSGLSFIVGVAVLIGWMFKGFGSWRFGRGRPVVVAFLMFVAWFLISASQALEPPRSFDSAWELSKFVLPFLVGVTLMQGEKDWRPMLWTIVLTQGYVGLEQNINYLLKGYNTAAEGFGGMDNNCFGAGLVTVLGPAIALMISSRTWASRCLAGTAAALILHTILLTFSRGTMLGLIAVAVTAFVMMPKKPRYIGALVLMALLAARFIGPELADRYSSTFVSAEERDGSAESRLDLWKDCLKVIQEYPVLGVGPANWRIIAARYGWPEGKSAHSVWMETGAELGVPGALLLMLFFLSAAIRLWPLARAPQTESNRYEIVLASGVILSIVGFVVAGQFVSVPGLEVPYYVTMLGAAMLKTTTRETVTGVAMTVRTPFQYQSAAPLASQSQRSAGL
jgi:probable O-glycosylation ligase (exosortase A-associated)